MASGPGNAERADKPGAGRHATTCPACQLTFRLSEAQLMEAGGLVRCGTCFKIFNSLDHLHGTSPATHYDDDDFYIDDDFDLSLLERLSSGYRGGESSKEHPDSTSVAKPDAAREPGTSALAGDDDIYIDDDFDLADLEHLTGGAGRPSPSRRQENIAPQSHHPAPPNRPATESATQASGGDDHQANLPHPPEAPVEPLAAHSVLPEQVFQPEQDLPAEQDPQTEQALHPEQGPQTEQALHPEQDLQTEQALHPEQDLQTGQALLPELPGNLAADPLESHLDVDEPRRRRRPWLTLVLIIMLALPLGYGHYHAATLAQDPRLEPALATLCRITGCALPTPTEETGEVTTTQLVLRSHPDQPGLLRLDALLVNAAASERHLPGLTLRFEDLQGTLMEERHFTPHQYLHGQQAADRPLAAGEALRIRLDLLDPGPDAVSYKLTTHPMDHLDTPRGSYRVR